MKILLPFAAVAATGALAVPASAQAQNPYPYAQPVPQPYPGQPGYGYQQPGYGYSNQGYAPNVLQSVVDQLLGNRYAAPDRSAVSRCASAALIQAERQYRPRGYNPYGQQYGQQPYAQPYGQPGAQAYGHNRYPQMRVTAITDVQRRSSGLRVRGLIDSGMFYGAQANPYGNQGYGYPGQGVDPRYARPGDLSFRCNVDYRGAVSSVRVTRNSQYRPY